jgi:hypothetical protein
MLNFFTDDEVVELNGRRARSAPYSQPRPLVAAAEPLKLTGNSRDRVDRRKPSAWQTASWQFFDQIGEIKFAFNLIGQAISQVRIYPAYVQNTDSPPVKVEELLKRLEDKDTTAHKTRQASKVATEAVEDLVHNAKNGISSFLREAAINISIPGEFYLVNHKGSWHCVSGDELQGSAGAYKLKSDRMSSTAEEQLSESAYVARVWRAHPRFSAEPDSSMLGVLDACEELVLLDQAMRIITRSRLNAGALFIPDGVGATTIEEQIAAAATGPIEDESAATTVVPLLLRGPAELGKEIKLIDLSRRVDSDMLDQQSRALDRVLAGVDIPKDIVQGLSQARYSNAIIITDEMYKSHIEPLILLLVDSLTRIVLQPALKKAGIDPDLSNNLVIWYDPSDIVTRPDRSQAANDGFDRKTLSAKAWRSARGFTEMDAPDEDELILRLALEKAQVPPDMAQVVLENLNQSFFDKEREEGQATSEMPGEIQQLLDPNATPAMPEQPEPGPPEEGPADDLNGGEVSPGGFMPPRPSTP